MHTLKQGPMHLRDRLAQKIKNIDGVKIIKQVPLHLRDRLVHKIYDYIGNRRLKTHQQQRMSCCWMLKQWYSGWCYQKSAQDMCNQKDCLKAVNKKKKSSRLCWIYLKSTSSFACTFEKKNYKTKCDTSKKAKIEII